jgi:hypothetical protein
MGAGSASAVFPASTRQTLHANMGGHTGVPAFAADAADQFFRRHLM